MSDNILGSRLNKLDEMVRDTELVQCEPWVRCALVALIHEVGMLSTYSRQLTMELSDKYLLQKQDGNVQVTLPMIHDNVFVSMVDNNRMLTDGLKIKAIRELRIAFDLSLVDAKHLTEGTTCIGPVTFRTPCNWATVEEFVDSLEKSFGLRLKVYV